MLGLLLSWARGICWLLIRLSLESERGPDPIKLNRTLGRLLVESALSIDRADFILDFLSCLFFSYLVISSRSIFFSLSKFSSLAKVIMSTSNDKFLTFLLLMLSWQDFDLGYDGICCKHLCFISSYVRNAGSPAILLTPSLSSLYPLAAKLSTNKF